MENHREISDSALIHENPIIFSEHYSSLWPQVLLGNNPFHCLHCYFVPGSSAIPHELLYLGVLEQAIEFSASMFHHLLKGIHSISAAVGEYLYEDGMK